MKAVTYTLVTPQHMAQGYYLTVSALSNDVLAKLEKEAYITIEKFIIYIGENIKEEHETDKSLYYLELLMMGVYWRQYIKRALALQPVAAKVLSSLSSLREEGKLAKRLFDPLRGILATLFLLKESRAEAKCLPQSLVKLIDWLNSAGDFKQEADRLKVWVGFLQSQDDEDAEKIICQAVELAQWFETKCTQQLGRYVENVDNFLQDNSTNYKWKENVIFCRRGKTEYFLNMVGAEIMNKAFRKGFVDSKVKRVLVPTCLRFQSNDKCKAVKTSVGYSCRQCSANCKVNSLVRLGREHNFSVSVIPHSTTAFSDGGTTHGETGIVGIACTLNLISGGFKAKARGLEPQCVLLNYCGCKKHWHKDGITTDFNVDRLLSLLQINSQKSQVY
ncbi:DUF116 domain-containing protein [Dethiobacter alkaliphilus]|uniref:DUF116 domain-containing protein n=1 Tax=Dethiobacter alkaliphilus TaxID=427926 RepID=UPI002226F635|nr:DUF116 domain-containing protein [Dethiobacter alkaliphilus]MCW3489744.1 DUF116 domain-containing protein [Dethiobacter alkaliphilus]